VPKVLRVPRVLKVKVEKLKVEIPGAGVWRRGFFLLVI
jgi:hypothetical protein